MYRNTRNNNIFIIFVTIECIILVFVGYVYYQKKVHRKSVLGAQFITYLNKGAMEFSEADMSGFYEPKPGEKWEDSPEWLGKTIEYSINHDGLNDRFNYPVEKPENTYRILTLGDSHTFGQFVKTGDNWPEKLEDMLNGSDLCYGKKHLKLLISVSRGMI